MSFTGTDTETFWSLVVVLFSLVIILLIMLVPELPRSSRSFLKNEVDLSK